MVVVIDLFGCIVLCFVGAMIYVKEVFFFLFFFEAFLGCEFLVVVMCVCYGFVSQSGYLGPVYFI